MNIRILNYYMDLCRELKKSPSIEGLRHFKMAFK